MGKTEKDHLRIVYTNYGDWFMIVLPIPFRGRNFDPECTNVGNKMSQTIHLGMVYTTYLWWGDGLWNCFTHIMLIYVDIF